MKKIGFFLLIGILCLDVQLFSHVRQEAEFACVIDHDRLYTAFRDEQVPLEVYETIAETVLLFYYRGHRIGCRRASTKEAGTKEKSDPG